MRPRYVDLYKRTLAKTATWLPDLTDAELVELWELEEDPRMLLADLTLLRATAELEVRRQTGVASAELSERREDTTRSAREAHLARVAKKGPGTAPKRSTKAKAAASSASGGGSGGGGGGFFGWFSRKKPKAPEAEEAKAETGPVVAQLTEEDRAALFKSLDFDPERVQREADKRAGLGADYRVAVVNVELGRASLTLREGGTSRPLVLSHLRAIRAGYCQMVDGLRASVAWQDFTVEDRVTEGSRAPLVVFRDSALRTGGLAAGAAKPLFELQLDMPSKERGATIGARVRAQPLRVIIAGRLLARLQRFLGSASLADGGALMEAAADQLAALGQSTRVQLEDMLARHTTLHLDVDATAPTVVLPQDTRRESCAAVTLDLGRFTIATALADHAEAKRRAKEEFASLRDVAEVMRERAATGGDGGAAGAGGAGAGAHASEPTTAAAAAETAAATAAGAGSVASWAAKLSPEKGACARSAAAGAHSRTHPRPHTFTAQHACTTTSSW